ncbi:chorismate mutase [Actinomycetospora straminea]|uniref:Chorismate mutase domain-containing protein n=1 Tax=Actinomycetospora straminea TaxID=663607 RepID=A0ABP9E3L0_9PSEU|nr:chorismate mutase [Actinomycetospora straminea]MDD7931193.1 chorismate mutase [Actinomycetospora straminea]
MSAATSSTDSPTDSAADAGSEDASPASTDAPAPLAPATADEIPSLREEIDAIDAELLRLVKRRSEISQRIGLARMAAGGPRIVYNREMQVLARFRDLGTEGRELAMLLLRLGRGRLGGRA